MTCQIGKECIGVGVGALIQNERGEILLALRSQQAKNERGKWEIPGGAVEFGETLEQALQREIKEEIGIEIEVGELLHVCNHILPEEQQHWVSPTYICQIKSGTPTIMEPQKCDALEWFTPEKALELSLSKVTIADIEVFAKRSFSQ